jgi:ATP-binding cassette subfamily C (CFTR/MRP) protein 4
LPASAATSTGEVVNLVSNDVQCFETASIMSHYAWAGPLELIIIMIVLYWRIGWPAFVGTSLLILLFPLHSLFARRYSYLRRKTTNYRVSTIIGCCFFFAIYINYNKLQDDRIRTVSDLLAGVELIKL